MTRLFLIASSLIVLMSRSPSPYTYEDSVLVKLSGFGASSIDLLVSAYLRTADMTRFLQMQNDLNLDLMDVMQKNGVDFAFPSTTVYLEKNN